jgi:hypothetical protein
VINKLDFIHLPEVIDQKALLAIIKDDEQYLRKKTLSFHEGQSIIGAYAE